jgi:hypothetical protein
LSVRRFKICSLQPASKIQHEDVLSNKFLENLLIKYLAIVRHYSKHFHLVGIIPVYKQGHNDTEKSGELTKIMQLVNGRETLKKQ